MKKISHNNLSFLRIEASDVDCSSILNCDIFVFLAKNNKMLKIRDQYTFFDLISLETYFSKAPNSIYILDPSSNKNSYDFTKNKFNPKLPKEFDSYLSPNRLSTALNAKENVTIAQILKADTNTPDNKKDISPEKKDEATETKPISLTSATIENSNKSFATEQAEEKNTIEAIKEDISAETKNTSASVIEEIINYSPEVIADNIERVANEKIEIEEIISAAKPAPEVLQQAESETKSEQNFSLINSPSTPEPESEFTLATNARSHVKTSFTDVDSDIAFLSESISNYSNEGLEETTISDWQPDEEENSIKIKTSVDALEEEFSKFSPEAKNFVDELRTISSDESENPSESRWVTRLDSNSPKLRGLEKYDAAAVKLSYSLSKHLTNLRGEINDNLSMENSEIATPEQIEERKKILRNSVIKNEVLLVLIESLDDEDFETHNLPKEFQDKSKQELLSYIEKSVRDLKGTLILSEEEFSLVQKKVDIFKANKFSIYGEAIEETNKRISDKIRQAKREKKSLSSDEVKQINQELQNQHRKAAVSINITKKLVETKKQLSVLLSTPSTPAEVSNREETAFRYQEEIHILESLSFSVESGEKMDEKIIAPFSENIQAPLVFSVDKEAEEEITRISTEMSKLKEELVQQKLEAEKETQILMEKINTPEPLSEEEKLLADDNEIEFFEKQFEEEEKRLVSGSDGKVLQSGVFAATFFRDLGYRNPQLERSLLLATYLFDYPEEKVREFFSEEVIQLYKISHQSEHTEELVAQDIALAIDLGRKYNNTPGVITGKFSVDKKIFQNLFAEYSKNSADASMLERIRQRAENGISRIERHNLINLAKRAIDDLNNWRRNHSA